MLRVKSFISTFLASIMVITTLFITGVPVQAQTAIGVSGGSYTFQAATDGSTDIWLVNDTTSSEYYVVDSDSAITSSAALSITVSTDVSLGSIRVNSGDLTLAGTSTLATTGGTGYALQVLAGNINIDGVNLTVAPTTNSGILADGDINIYGSATVTVTGYADGTTAYYGIGARNGNINISGNGTHVAITNSGTTGLLATDAASIGSVGNITIGGESSLEVSYSGRRAASHGIQAANNISIVNATVTSSNNTNGRGMSADTGYVVINNSIVTTENNLNTGIYSNSSYVSITGGQVTARYNGSAGILAGENLTIDGGANVTSSNNINYYGICSRRGDISILNGSTVTAADNGSDGITAQGAILLDNNEPLVNGHLTISNAYVWLENNGNHAMSAADSISVTDFAQVYASANIIEVTTYVYLGDLTVDNSLLNSEGGIQVLGGSIIARNNATIYATEALYNMGTSTDELPGIFAAGDITAEYSSSILGVGNVYGVYAEGTITAVDSTIHGFAKTRGLHGMPTAAVYSNQQVINASGVSEIWENYSNMPVAFNNITPEYPYALGSNIASIENYTWDPDLIVSDDGTGLLATAAFDYTQITGKRGAYVDGEPVVLRDGSTHVITFDGLSQIETFTVTYLQNLGYGADYIDSGLLPNSLYEILGNDTVGFSRVGYSFDGWNTYADGSGTRYDDGDTIIITGDVTLYAQWTQDSYTVTYDGNGDDAAGASNFSENHTYGTATTAINSFTRTGYDFAGWNTAADGTGSGYEENEAFTVTGNITLYAQWIETPTSDITVYYEANGGQGSYSEVVLAGSSYTIQTADGAGISRTGYTFSAWLGNDGATYAEGQPITAPATNLILHAQWLADSYTLTLAPGIAGGTSQTADNLTYGEVYTLPDATNISWALAGYEFTGWNFEEDGSGITYSPGAEIVITGNTTLFAQWQHTGNTYTVTYHCNGGYGLVYDTNEYYEGDTAVVMASSLLRTGYTFTGWNTQADGSGNWYYENDTITITGNVDLYAQWQLLTFTLTYSANNGTQEYYTDGVTYYYGDEITILDNIFSWVGRRFIEWDNHASGNGDSFEPGATLVMVEDENLHAQWEMENYTVTYNANGGSGTTLDEAIYHYGDYAIAAPNGFTKDNATFTGWNTQADGTGTSYAIDEWVLIGGNTTLYAQWSSNGASTGTSAATADASQLPLWLALNSLAIACIGTSVVLYRKKKARKG